MSLKSLRLIFLLTLLLITALSAAAHWLYTYRLNYPLELPEDSFYTVKNGMHLAQIATELQAQGWFDYPTALTWVWLARAQQRANQIKTGEYAIPRGTTPLNLLDIFVAGKTVQHGMTIIEGWNFRQLRAAMSAHRVLVQTLTGMSDEMLMQTLGYAGVHPEGRFYPDTYHFPRGTTDVAFLQRAYQKMQAELNTAWAQRPTDTWLQTPEQALILASIVEKETANPTEYGLIAGVFTRRLQQDMRLQTDPTVIYALGMQYDGNLRKEDLSIDNPYNTYRYKGLPPTPIAMPSRAALIAALNPTQGNTLYFVSKNDGTHHFSASLSDHECAVITYQIKGKSAQRFRQWCDRNLRCPACL